MAKSALPAIRKIFEMMAKGPGFDNVYKTMQIVSVEKGRCVCELKVDESHQNRGGTLHGGVTASLVDTVSTLALMTVDQEPRAGVSVDMNITYMKAGKVGEDIVIESNALKVGRTLAFLTVDIRRKEDNALLAQGRHTKYVG